MMKFEESVERAGKKSGGTYAPGIRSMSEIACWVEHADRYYVMHGTACMRVTEDEEQHLEWPIEHSRMGGRACVVKGLGTISLLGSLLVSSVFFNTPPHSRQQRRVQGVMGRLRVAGVDTWDGVCNMWLGKFGCARG